MFCCFYQKNFIKKFRQRNFIKKKALISVDNIEAIKKLENNKLPGILFAARINKKQSTEIKIITSCSHQLVFSIVHQLPSIKLEGTLKAVAFVLGCFCARS